MRLFRKEVREGQVNVVFMAFTAEAAAFRDIGTGDTAPAARASAVLQRAKANATDSEINEALRRWRK
jgi:hypothetical protein